MPQWLRGPPEIAVPSGEPATVPVSISDDPSLLRAPPPVPPTAPSGASPRPLAAVSAPATPPSSPLRTGERLSTVVPSTADRGLLDARLSLAVRDLERRWNLTLDARLKEAQEATGRSAEALRSELGARLQELEQRPAPSAPNLGPEVEAQVAAKVDPKIAEIESRVSEAIRSTAEGWAERFRRDLKEASEELAARSAKSEEDLRAALVAQLDLELLESKEQGTALREEIESRVRGILDGRLAEGEERRLKEVRELEQRVGILVDGRTKDLEEQLAAALGNEAQRLAASMDDRVAHVERRLAVERDARLSEINEAHRAALAGLQVRMQAFVEQMVRENQAAEQEKYIELLARLKAELEGAIAGAIRSPEFGAQLDRRISSAVDGPQTELRTTLLQTVADAEGRLRAETEGLPGRLAEVEKQVGAREGELAASEGRLHEEIAELDRRVMVINDHVLPIVRQTWLKLNEHEANVRSKPSEAQLAAVRKEVLEELKRAEEEFGRVTADLRERLETAVQSHGRIWLNFLRMFPTEGGPVGGFPAPASTPTASHRVPKRLRPAGTTPTPAALAPEPVPDRPPFANDPPNPMDPELAAEADRLEPRRRVRKSA